MLKVKVHIDNVGYTNEKPTTLYGVIKPRLQCENNIKEISIVELVNKIGQGYAVSPSILKGGLSANNWVEQTLFMVDIDNKETTPNMLTLDEALYICKKYNIQPTFSYYTYSNTQSVPRFRIAFIMNNTITNKKEREKIIKTLVALFPNHDDNCTNADRMFLGTNQETFIYDENATISLEQIDNIIKLKNCNTLNNTYNKCNNSTDNKILKGNRNNKLFIHACKLAEKDLSFNKILSIIKTKNIELCEKPLSNKEIYTLIKSAIKHVNNIPPYIHRTNKNDKVQYNVSTQLLAQFIKDNAHYFLVKDNANEKTMIYWYTNGVYKIINEDILKGHIKSYIQNYDITLYKSSIVNEVYKDLITDLNFISQDELNDNENYINFENGIYDIKSRNLIPHNPNIITTIQIPCNWNSNAIDAPNFISYLDYLTNNSEDKKTLLLQFIGVCISNIKGYRLKKALFLVGDGNTGKSQFKSLIEKILGKDNYASIDLSELEERFGTSMIYNKRLAGSSDMSFATIKELKQFKKITGGDSIFTEFKGQQGFNQIYKGLLLFCCNKLPKFSGDNGKWVYDRIIVIRCDNIVPLEKQDKYLLEKMFNERESIVKLAINELQKVIDNGYEFVISDGIKHETIIYRQDNSTVASFIKECCCKRTTFNDGCSCRKMYNIYKEYCNYNNNGYCKTANEFKEELIELSNYSSDSIIKRTNTNTFYVPYTITLETYIQYNKVIGYNEYFEIKKRIGNNDT